MTNQIPVSTVTDATNFRLYLRHKFYGPNLEFIANSIRANMMDDIQNIEYTPADTTFLISIKNPHTDSVLIYYSIIRNIILNIMESMHLDSIIFSDNTLTSDQKNKYLSIHKNMINDQQLCEFFYVFKILTPEVISLSL